MIGLIMIVMTIISAPKNEDKITAEGLLPEVQASEASKQRNNSRTIWCSSSESHHRRQ
jgi:hypothetical protein